MEYLTVTPRHAPSKSYMISLNVPGNYKIMHCTIFFLSRYDNALYICKIFSLWAVMIHKDNAHR